MAMAARMMSCCSTALLSRAVVIRPHCIHRHVGVGVSLYGAEFRKEKARIQQHRTICCSSASSPNNATEVQIQLYNTMKRQKELFRPLVPGKVSMYVCGVTSYDYSHIGHARVYVAFDVLFRYLKSVGFDVTYVRNFTDIDDKIIKRANELGEDPVELSRRFCEEFQVDMELLRCLSPSVEPRVTEHIPQIIKMISKIIENGNGYVMDGGDVYFAVDTLPTYGSLSGRKPEENRAGERVTVDNRKQNPADFALWKVSALASEYETRRTSLGQSLGFWTPGLAH